MKDQKKGAPDCHGDTAQRAEWIVIRTNGLSWALLESNVFTQVGDDEILLNIR